VHERGGTIKALGRQFLDLSTTIGKSILAFYRPWLRTSASAS